MNKLFIHENHTPSVHTPCFVFHASTPTHATIAPRHVKSNSQMLTIGLFQHYRAHSLANSKVPKRRRIRARATDRARAHIRTHRCIRTPHVCCVPSRADVGVVLGVGTFGSRVGECRQQEKRIVAHSCARLSCARARRFGDAGCGGRRPRPRRPSRCSRQSCGR